MIEANFKINVEDVSSDLTNDVCVNTRQLKTRFVTDGTDPHVANG